MTEKMKTRFYNYWSAQVLPGDCHVIDEAEMRRLFPLLNEGGAQRPAPLWCQAHPTHPLAAVVLVLNPTHSFTTTEFTGGIVIREGHFDDGRMAVCVSACSFFVEL